MGLGSLGQKIVRYISERSGIEIVGAADINPEITGKDVGSVSGIDSLGVAISGSITDATDSCDADCAILTTVSSLEVIAPQILEIVAGGLPVVSTCEELLHP